MTGPAKKTTKTATAPVKNDDDDNDNKNKEDDEKDDEDEKDDNDEKDDDDDKNDEKDSKDDNKKKNKRSSSEVEDDAAMGVKRKRMSSLESSFEPVDFTMHTGHAEVTIILGRGKELKEFPSVVASMEKHTMEDILFAHKFLFGNKGSSAKKKGLLENLGDFSGYLKKAPKGYDKDKLEKEDEREEEKYSKKAFKMILAQVRMLCDFFDVIRVDDDGKPLNKDDMIENLLDFLSQPHKDFLNSEYPDLLSKKSANGKMASTTKKAPNTDSTKKADTPKKVDNSKKAPSTKTAKKAPSPEKSTVSPKKKEDVKPEKTAVVKNVSRSPTKPKAEPAKDPFTLVKKHKRGAEPNDAALRQWVKAYIVCFDMNKATTKHAIQTASEKFGVDLSGKKNTIKEMLADEM